VATFFIEFDTLAGHNPGTGATLPPQVLSPVGWRSIGNPGGGRFINQTGGTIRAIHLAVNGTANVFRVTSASAGRLFNTVWAKLTVPPDTASEVYFMDGNVANFGAFWMRVPPNTPGEIQQCDSGQECPFQGQVYAQNPAAPAGPGWTRLRSPLPAATPRWADLIAATPSDYREIAAYGETPDGQSILFLSHGELLHYDDGKKTVSRVAPPKAGTSPPVNAIAFDASAGAFNLLHNGTVVGRVKAANPPGLTELGRAV
jgi:hypothetical protein